MMGSSSEDSSSPSIPSMTCLEVRVSELRFESVRGSGVCFGIKDWRKDQD